MKTANELLQGILTVVGKIEQNQRRSEEEKRRGEEEKSDGKKIMGIFQGLISFSKVKEKDRKQFISFIEDILKISEKGGKKGEKFKVFSEGIAIISTSLPQLIIGLNELGKIRARRVDRAIQTLEKLYTFAAEAGEPKKVNKVKRAIKTFDELGKSLNKIARPLKQLSLFLTYVGLSIVVFAAGLVAATLLLKLTKPILAVAVLIGVITAIVGVITLLAVIGGKFLKRGIQVIKGIGKGFLFLSLGILGFTLSLLAIAAVMKAGIGFAGIMKALLVLGGVVLITAGFFVILSYAKRFVIPGVIVAGLIGLGLAIIGLSLGFLATVAAKISSQFGDKKEGKKVKFLGMDVSPIVRGLGTMGLIFIGAAGLFAILGIPAVASIVGLGAAVAILVSGSLYVLAVSTSKLVEVSKKLEGVEIADSIAHMIGGVLYGVAGGLTYGLTGGKTGWKGIKTALKNVAILTAGIGVLFGISLTLSMFAKAITAFAELENMRIIKGYKENGEPIFGEKVDVRKVGDNITYTISTFLAALIEATAGLTIKQARGIRKMRRALTGKHGILAGVIQFADALKVYAEFGEKNEIGYIDFDDKGNEIRKKVSAKKVVDNIISSFLYFTNNLFSKSETEFGDGEPGISGRQRRRMKKMSKALVGRHGILGAVISFADTLGIFSKYGEKNEIPILDTEGKPTGKTIKVEKIAENIVSVLTKFSTIIAEKLEKNEAKEAGKNIKKYSSMITELSNLSKATTGLSKLSTTIMSLAEALSKLSLSIKDLDTAKLRTISSTGAAYLEKTNDYSVPSKRIMEKTVEANMPPGTTTYHTYTTAATEAKKEIEQPNWDYISAQIGNQVGSQLVAAMKSGQLKFEFSPANGRSGILEFS